MQSEVIAKRTARAAVAVLAATVEMWEWDAELAGRTAAEDERQAWKARPSTEVVSADLYVAMAANRAVNEAKRTLVAKTWEVYATPDEHERRWILVPLGWDGVPRTGDDAADGHLVIDPGDTIGQIEAKLDALRKRRRTITSAKECIR